MMSRIIPSEITLAEKQGFSGPDASWFKWDSIEFVKRTLFQGNPRVYDVLSRQAVGELVEQHLRGEQNRRLLIWSLLSVEAWMQITL
jgi:asparagine synthase (glutamine-hydrolysing)